MSSIRRKREGTQVLDDSFAQVYGKFKLHFYQEIFSTFQDREASLTAVETFCMEVILALKEPTVTHPQMRPTRSTA